MLLAHKALAETMGTFTMVFVGGGSIILSEKHIIPAFCIPIAWGLVICLMIVAVGSVSGAHFNPAVTLAFAIAKRLPPSEVLFYWMSQFMGGAMAVLLLGVLNK